MFSKVRKGTYLHIINLWDEGCHRSLGHLVTIGIKWNKNKEIRGQKTKSGSHTELWEAGHGTGWLPPVFENHRPFLMTGMHKQGGRSSGTQSSAAVPCGRHQKESMGLVLGESFLVLFPFSLFLLKIFSFNIFCLHFSFLSTFPRSSPSYSIFFSLKNKETNKTPHKNENKNKQLSVRQKMPKNPKWNQKSIKHHWVHAVLVNYS